MSSGVEKQVAACPMRICTQSAAANGKSILVRCSSRMILLLARSAPCDLVSLGDRVAERAGPVLGEMARKRVTANGYRRHTKMINIGK
jgi:hypothetical protein